MSGFYAKRISAIALILGLGVSHCYGITILGGTSAIVDSWKISPDAGVTIDATADTNGLTINKIVTFTSDNSLGITFQQTDGPAPMDVNFATESITNSTGSDWTGFQFTVTGAATINGISNIFAPPFGTGVNYISASVNAAEMQVTYSGSQLNGATSIWGDVSTGDSLMISADTTTNAPFASFTLAELPIGGTSAVPAPSPLWLSLIGVLSLGLIPGVRKIVRA
jgi:hypothetical protein